MTKKSGIGIGILGIGAYLPENVRTNDWWSKAFVDEHIKHLSTDVITGATHPSQANRGEVDPEILKYSALVATDPFRGARERRIMGDDQNSSDMEVAAAKDAMRRARVTASDIDLLINFSQVLDFGGPGNHPLVAEKLGLPKSVASMTLGTECGSFIPHMKVAANLLRSGEHKTALVVQSNAASRILNWKRPASLNVGDGAVATVLSTVEKDYGYISSMIGTHGEFHAAVRLAPEDAPNELWYRSGTHKSDLVIQSMDFEASRVSAGQAVSLCKEACQTLLNNNGYEARDVDFFVASQPTVWFGDACCEALGIDPSKTLNTFAKYAHLMPASAPINLFTANETKRLRRGDLVLVYSPGAGFTQGAMLYRWNL